MTDHKSPYRYLCTLVAAVVFLFAVHPLRAMAEPAKESSDEEFYQASYLMLSAREYKQLEQSFKGYLDLYAGNKITAEDLARKFGIFSRMSTLEPRFDEWVKSFPKSYTARLARGIYRTADAWEKRGNNFARSTSDDQLGRFRETLKDAQSDLLLSIQLYARPVDSYRYLIRVAKGLDLGIERNLLDSALKLDPKAMEVRFEYLEAITPKWGGDVELMQSFLEESNRSEMTDRNKRVIEGKYYYSMGEQAKFDNDYKTASTYFYKYYLTNRNPSALQSAGQAALDGDFKNLAFERFDELVRDHPKYQYGYELRGYLYETNLKDSAKAVEDYLTAADLGAHWSQNRMGWYYMMGITVPVDYVKARHYLELAAKQGNGNAIANLATLEKLQNHSR